MIDSREQLIHVLTEAAEVEHNLLCSYLYAAFSLKRRGEAGLTEAQAQTVERWRKMVLSVAIEEMAHLASVNNLLLAVGGAPHLDRPNLPVAPGYHPAGVVIRLTPFNAATLDHFIFLERPEQSTLKDASGFDPIGGRRGSLSHFVTPSAIDYTTIGELYDALAEGFGRLVGRLGEEVLIDTSAQGQLGPDEASLPGVAKIRGLADALAVIETIKEQGEGSSGRHDDCHYEKFVQIKREWKVMADEDPGFVPAWPAAEDPVMRRPADHMKRVWLNQAPAAPILDLGNAAYGAMIGMLSQVFALKDPVEQSALMQACVQLMEVAAAAGNGLARMPAGEAWPACNAGLTFTAPRNLGFRPSQTRVHLLERVAELHIRAGEILSGPVLEKVQYRLSNCASTLYVVPAREV